MSSVAKPNQPKKVAEKLIDWRKSNDVTRRLDLTMEILLALDCYEVNADSDPAEDFAEALSVILATTAYLYASNAVPEKEACSSFRKLFRQIRQIEKRLNSKKGNRPTVKDVFTEIAIDTIDEE
jgi:hypothetical protein